MAAGGCMVWKISGFCKTLGVLTDFFSVYWMGMAIEIESPQQPW